MVLANLLQRSGSECSIKVDGTVKKKKKMHFAAPGMKFHKTLVLPPLLAMM